jgi:N-acetylmuramic acid 6-phosphate etherase
VHETGSGAPCLSPEEVPAAFLEGLEEIHRILRSDDILNPLSQLVALEENVYRAGHKTNYFAQGFGIDVLTDTTERSPTYCTPPFRKYDDTNAAESWAFLFLPVQSTPEAWEALLKRRPQCIEWNPNEIQNLVPRENYARTSEILQGIGYQQLMRFKIGLDGIAHRELVAGDAAIAIITNEERNLLISPLGYLHGQLKSAIEAGAKAGVIAATSEVAREQMRTFLQSCAPDLPAVLLPALKTSFLLDGVIRVALKMVLNALSTCVMVRLGRVMGNFMIWVVPSNLKLIDRATRYIQKLTGIDYPSANFLLFEVIEHVEPRMKAGKTTPPVVGMAVLRSRKKISNEEAEKQLAAGSLIA